MRSMRILTVIVMTSASILTLMTASAKSSNQAETTYGNEKAIEFTANDGQKTAAFQGSIRVPENRHDKNSKTIEVGYVRFPATGVKNGSPIIYLAGGPGGSGIGTAKWRRFPLFMAMREFGDVIALDQRGTGVSTKAPECISDQTVAHTQKITMAELTKKYRLAGKNCLQFWRSKGFDPLGYTTLQSAHDLDDLRKHLQADKVTLWGISYGSHLAFAAMKIMESKIDKVILASAEGLDQTVKLPARTFAYFQRVQQVIDQQPLLKKQFPDVIAMIKRVNNKLEESPIMINIPRKDGGKLALLFQKGHMQMIASMMIADPGQYLAMLLNIYQGLERDNTQLLSAVLQRGMFNDNRIKFNLMPFAMDVASGISDERLSLVNQQAKDSLLGDMLNFPMPHLNQIASNLDLGDSFRQPAMNNIPTLLFTGTLDGRTYVEGQKEAVRGLNNLTHILVENAGHNLFTASPNVLEAIQLFMRDQKIEIKTIKTPLPQLKL